MAKRRTAAAATIATLIATAAAVGQAEEPATLDALITSYLDGRGATVQFAPAPQLARRLALDLTGVVPSFADLDATANMTPGEMFDYFAAKPAMVHTGTERPYVWIQLLKDADHFLYSNSTQFSQLAHITAFNTELRRVYDEGYSYLEFSRWALESQMFLNRFPSAADRANAAFFLFLGRDSLAPEVPVGNMWNAYQLLDDSIPAGQAEIDPNYHVYALDPAICSSGTVLCEATVWSTTGATPAEAIALLTDSPLFAEATVDRYWARAMGVPLPGVEFPDVRRMLVQGFVASGYNVNWLLRELMTSPAYTQEMMYR
jgi:hypothetical protein